MLKPRPPLRTLIVAVLLAVSAGVVVAPLLGADSAMRERIEVAVVVAAAAIAGSVLGRRRRDGP